MASSPEVAPSQDNSETSPPFQDSSSSSLPSLSSFMLLSDQSSQPASDNSSSSAHASLPSLSDRQSLPPPSPPSDQSPPPAPSQSSSSQNSTSSSDSPLPPPSSSSPSDQSSPQPSPSASPASSPPAPPSSPPLASPPPAENAPPPSPSPPSDSSPPHPSPCPQPCSPSPPPPSPLPGSRPPPNSSTSAPPPSGSPPPPPTTTPPPSMINGSPPPVALSPPASSSIKSQTPPPSSPSLPSKSTSAINSSSPSQPSPSPQSQAPIAAVAIIAGIVGGGVVLLLFVVVCLMCRRRRKKAVPYYIDTERAPKGGNQYSPQNIDQIVNLPPSPGLMVTPVGNRASGWGATSSPLPATNNSNHFSPTHYLGQYHPSPPLQAASPMGGIGTISQFTYEELAAATNGFSQSNLLGEGGFGFVHKGLLSDGREVAVKSLKSGSGQGEREFQAEVEIISRVHHRHLVSLVGYCIGSGQIMLVYEFVPNKTLEFHLHGKGRPVMDWATRLRMAVGSARGLAYLHEDCHSRIIHRDVKAANILLDCNFEAMVADFGLAKLTSDNYSHVSTRVMGTFGYLAPEYASSGKLTEKSDVFSFGVMLLELITGRRPVDLSSNSTEDSLVDWARPLLSKALEDGNFDGLVDPRLEGKYDTHELARMATSAAAGIRHSARRRPKMSQIVRALDGDSSILEELNEGVKPGQSILYNPNGSAEPYDTGAYNADMMKLKKMVMSSQEFNSSEYETSDYAMSSSSAGASNEMGRTKP